MILQINFCENGIFKNTLANTHQNLLTFSLAINNVTLLFMCYSNCHSSIDYRVATFKKKQVFQKLKNNAELLKLMFFFQLNKT